MKMRTSLLGMSLIGLMATSTFAQAQNYAHQQRYTEADEGRRFNDGTRVRCRNVEVQKNSTDPNRIGGTLAGAAIGGLLGNQVGGGNGKKLATVAGAVAGGGGGGAPRALASLTVRPGPPAASTKLQRQTPLLSPLTP